MKPYVSKDREKLRFETDLEKEFHKIISSLGFGDSISVDTKIESKEDEHEVIKAIKKSEMYNLMDISYRFDKNKTSVTITVELY